MAEPAAGAAARYLAIAVPEHLVWELLQLPLYTIWHDGRAGEIARAVIHCTAGDALIAVATLGSALLTAGRSWPARNRGRVAVIAVALGMSYAIFSE